MDRPRPYCLVTIAALILVILSRRSADNPLGMIVILGLLAIAFSTQLLPLTIDMLFLNKGTSSGAIAGIIVGLIIIFFLSPFFPMVAGTSFNDLIASMKTMIDTGAWGLVGNTFTFIGVSTLTKKPSGRS